MEANGNKGLICLAQAEIGQPVIVVAKEPGLAMPYK